MINDDGHVICPNCNHDHWDEMRKCNPIGFKRTSSDGYKPICVKCKRELLDD